MNSRLKMNNFNTTDLYALTGEEFSLGRSNVEVVKKLINAGIKVIQYREKTKKARYKYEECLKIRQLTAEAGVTFIINDNIDIAVAVKADGVHIGQEDLPPAIVRKLVGEDMIIGLSTHKPEEAIEAQNMKIVDYIGVGPIFSTTTKKDVCQPVGLSYLEYVANNIKLPFVAIGGIKINNIVQVKNSGAKIAAMITEIVGAEDIEKRIEEIRRTYMDIKVN